MVSKAKAASLLVTLLVALAVLTAIVGCAQVQQSDEGIAARYGDSVITEQEVNDYTEQFRSEHVYGDDANWAAYLRDQGLTASTWRNQAIRAIVERRLVEKRAAELGIVADTDLVQSQIAADKEAAGIAADDAAAWQSYLDSRGLTQEAYEDGIRYASLRSLVLQKELALDPVEDESVLDAYIHDNLISRVVRRYCVLCYDEKKAAAKALAQLQGLSGEELERAFATRADEDDSNETTSGNGGDAGWDLANSWGQMQQELNEEMLAAGALSNEIHELDGKYYVVMCTDRFEFGSDTTYGDLPDRALKDYVHDAATYAAWSDMSAEYLAKLVDNAHVQVREASEKLPYDVDDQIGD